MISWISVVFVVSPFAFLILLFWGFFSHQFSQICQESVNLINFFKEPAFCFIHSLYFWGGSISLISVSFLLLLSLFWDILDLVFLGV
jgi:hypothetical protein